MKAIVIYYSLDGNTDAAARKIAAATGAKLLRLLPVKEYPSKGFKKYFLCGKSASFGEKPRLKNGEINLAPYDTVILGMPVWAGKAAPPMVSFLSHANLQHKKVALFLCNSGGSTAKCYGKLEKLLGDNKPLAKTEFVNLLKTPAPDVKSTVSAFCTKIS